MAGKLKRVKKKPEFYELPYPIITLKFVHVDTVDLFLFAGANVRDHQEFSGSLGHTFVGNCFFFFITMQDNSIILLMVRVDVNSWLRVSHEIREH